MCQNLTENTSFKFKSILELVQGFPTELSARQHFAKIRWKEKIAYPNCGHFEVYTRKCGTKLSATGAKRSLK